MKIQTSLPIVSMSFRTFFPLAALAAILYPTLMASISTGSLAYSGFMINALAWHGHEMIFGFTLALVVGFLFTAGSHWTGNPPLQGKHLAGLAGLWILERLAFALPLGNLWLFTAMTLPFLIVVLAYMIHMLRGSRKNLIVFSFLLSCLLASKSFYILHVWTNDVSYLMYAKTLGLGTFKVMIVIIAGRIIPFFSKKRFPDYPISVPSWVNGGAIASALGVMFLQLVVEGNVLTTFFVISALFQFLRLSFWTRRKFFSEPMLLILWLGYLWLGLHFALEAGVRLFPVWGFAQSALHAFGAGTLGLFAMGMMSRVSLGHTQRPIKADGFLVAAFLCVFIGALIRVGVPLFEPNFFLSSMHYGSGFWTLGFLILLFKFIPIWLRA
ncbi:MAG: NnrS family protein [Deltaproteobacteria bacterium]|nr:NnrS family protein [Deltaproteobacteria bacterium]